MNSFVCKRCGSKGEAKIMNHIEYLFKGNEMITSEGVCRRCGTRFFYIEKTDTLSETVFPDEDYGFCKRLKSINKIYTSYMPVLDFVQEYKDKILSTRTKNDVVIGFDGWEDIVIDKSLAGGWYMTYNSPPILDVAVINCSNYCFGDPEIVMSYFPTPILSGKVKILDNRTVEYFEKARTVMLDEKKTFYLGIRV